MKWLDHIRRFWRKLWRRSEPQPKPAPEPAPEHSPLTSGRAHRPPPEAPPAAPPAPPAPPPPAKAPAILAPAPPDDDWYSNEQSKAFLLARLRHDKFVKPKGERPKREPRPKKAKPVVAVPDDEQPIPVGVIKDDAVAESVIKSGNFFVADEWMEGDGQGNVLFHEAEFWGEFNFRDTILDQLDRYWVYLERMRRYDFGAYIMCRKLGATLVPYSSSWSNRIHHPKKERTKTVEEFKEGIELPSWFKRHWPSFGFVVVGANPADEAQEIASKTDGEWKLQNKLLWCVKLLYFQKYSKVPWYVQPVRGGHLYELTVWWDRPHDPKNYRRKYGVPQSYFIWIADDGNSMRVLKTRKSGSKYLAPWDWQIDFAVDPEDRKLGFTPQLILARKFCDTAKMVEHASYSMCRVEVSKGDMTATFGVSPRRMAYFFRDRDINVNADGQTKRIFHIVRPHKRANGAVVPMHFRGLKQFTWADYNVSITVPGRDHFMLPEIDVGVQSPPEHGRWPKGLIDEEKAATKFKEMIKRGLGGHHHH